ncbi:CheD [Leptothrix cholodnii SP-6]|uniref:Probable chemoreceptor glutamine deamidase CheD n=1 Tax=Leptothrix cholodnii (strain ATCC 51168 / LMG 8142 / SP-6) TaxID=395495 RepID=B1XWC7_LEPCP|nr:CheD [Leptothrix cholodnii SP-6]
MVAKAPPGHDLLLMPGQLYFGNQPSAVRTLLGSCVAVTLWHPKRRIGGMCHYLLPERNGGAGLPRDGRYGTDAIELLVEAVHHMGTHCHDYEAHLYGGADTLPGHLAHKPNVGVRNIEIGWSLVDRHGFQLMGVDVGDNVPRTVRLNMKTGEVQMRRSER